VSSPPSDDRGPLTPAPELDDGDPSGDDELTQTSTDNEDDATQVAAPAARKRKSGSMAAVEAIKSVHSAATQQLPVVKVPGVTTDETSIKSTASTPLEALRLDEVGRTRAFLRICMMIVVSVLVALQVIDGDPVAKRLVYAGCALAAATMGWLLWEIRDPAGYHIRKVTVVGYSLIVASYMGVYFWGIFSPAPAIILMGIYFFSLGGSKGATSAIYITCAVTQAALAAGVSTGVIPDRGLIQAGDLALREQIATQLMVQVLFACAYLIARASRRATVDAVDKLEKAVRQVAAREALLLEARQDLDRALKVGGPGRFTGQKLGSFELGNLIGRGGMGEVYEAIHTGGGDPAAVKMLHPHAMANPDHVTRFLRETEAAAALRSENVVKVLEVGRTDGDVPYFAMERLRGNDLAYHLRKRRRLSPNRVAALVEQVGQGLEAARNAGIVHRDIKPQNLFLAESGERAVWKILDFGVSKLAGGSGTLTRGHVVGTPGYMAPEQAQGKPVDHRADLYALAAIAYRTLTGHPPFSGKDVPSTLYEVVYRMPKRPSGLVEIDEDIDFVLAIGLAKDPDQRWESGAAMAAALSAAARGELSVDVRDRAREILHAHPWGELI
jgi:serine/threonine-protein kinase